MHLTHLSLQNFRNLLELELDLDRGVTVLFGGNAQGKTNLLEAISMLATAKSLRASNERELISWSSDQQDEIPYTRLRGTVLRSKGPVQVELVMQLAKTSFDEGGLLQKRARINGVNKRVTDLVGEVNAVLFSPQDIELVHGPPSLRRQYLNIMLSQADRSLLRVLQRYTKVLSQRNSLLKAIREHMAHPKELDFWDSELVESGTIITNQRIEAMAALRLLAFEIQRELTGGVEELDLVYAPSVPVVKGQDLAESYRLALEAARDREMAMGASMVGPHRDDFAFETGGRDMGLFASRGQQRTASLALKLAEARFLADRASDPPILLLDDVFSELDAHRRGYLLAWISSWDQALLTTAEPERIDRRVIASAHMLEVKAGQVRSSEGSTEGRSPFEGGQRG